MQTSPENFRQAMAMSPGAVTVVTTGEGGLLGYGWSASKSRLPLTQSPE